MDSRDGTRAGDGTHSTDGTGAWDAIGSTDRASSGGDRHPAERDLPDGPRAVPTGPDGTGDAAEAAVRPPAATPRRRLDLSVPQVAGSAVAAVVAAKLASNLGVYGTIAGAGVVSALGTCGGSVLSHVFRHTGRRVQEAAVQAGPAARRALTRADGAHRATAALPAKDLDRKAAAPYASPGGGRDRTEPVNAATAGGHDGYGEATSYRAGAGRRRGLRRPVVAVALAFGLTMAGITGYEALAGENLSGHGGTTIGNALTGHGTGHSGGSTRPTQQEREQEQGTPSPDRHPGGGGTPTPHPTTTGAGDGSPVTPGPGPSEPAPTTPPATPDPAPTPDDGAGGGSPTATPSPGVTQPDGR
jgi:hypothetical protein